jgi:hypothetical protein
MASNSNWAISPNKKTHHYIIGIDFGHGETSAAYAEIGWEEEMGTLEPVKDIDITQDKSYVIPSAISINTNGDIHIGADAFEYQDSEIHVCFKQKPISIDGDAEKLMIKFMHAVYDLVRERIGSTLTDTNHIVYIATPSGWDKAAQNLYGEMAAKAGIPIAGVTWESRAAFIKAQNSADSGLPQYVDKGAIVFDMGSSTLDFTYISSDVIKENQKPIDFGYDCGASEVERIMYKQLKEENKVITSFEEKYPSSIDRLLFEMRKAKEEYYRKAEHKLRKTIDFYQLVNDDDLSILRYSYDTNQLDELLKAKGYIEKIRKSMIDFMENHIKGKPIYAAFFTGGASRMNFLELLVREEWKVDFIFRDQNPSLTISQGVAEAARSDVRSGGTGKIKEEIKKIMSGIDIYSIFIKKLGTKMEDEIEASIANPVIQFAEAEEDYCLADLEMSIQANIEGDIKNISVWAKESIKSAFEEATEAIKNKMNTMMANYSKSNIKMREISTKKMDFPNLDLDIVSNQIKELSSFFAENTSEWTGIITGTAIGAVAGFLLGPIGWIGMGLVAAWKIFFGEEETEEQKRAKAKNKSLNIVERKKVYEEFENNWENICMQINDSIMKALDKPSLRIKVNNQCKTILHEYAEDCLRQTRIMLD